MLTEQDRMIQELIGRLTKLEEASNLAEMNALRKRLASAELAAKQAVRDSLCTQDRLREVTSTLNAIREKLHRAVDMAINDVD